jgi:LacI family transcriptional regulator
LLLGEKSVIMPNRNKHVTIYDVAKALGVSTSTVSRAMRDHHTIGKATIKKVKKVAMEMGYEPNAIASSLREKRTKTIGVIVSYINRPFISSLIRGIEEVASKNKYNVIITQSLDSYKKEVEDVKTMYNSRVDGLIVSLAMETTKYKHFDPYLKMNYPLVLADRVASEIDTDKVLIDNFSAAYGATKHLIEQGYKKIGHLAGAQQQFVYKKRLEGYVAALKDHGFEKEEALIHYSRLNHEDGRDGAKSLLKLSARPDAVFAANDTSAIGFMQYVEEVGLAIPQDIGIVGFNNDLISSIVRPQLSTVDHPGIEIGRKSAELILEKLFNKSLNTIPQTVTFRTQLIVRESSRRD